MSDQQPPDTSRGPGAPTMSHPAYPTYPNAPVHRGPVSQTPATWAIILAVVPIPVGWLIAVGLAIGVLRDSRDGRGKERGAGMAIAALVIVPVWITVVVGALLTGEFAGSSDRGSDGRITARGDALTSSLRVGDCLPTTPETTGLAVTVEVVPCTEDHTGEVFAVFTLADGRYPGDAQVARLGEGGCVRRLQETSSGTAATEQDLFYYLPTRGSWSTDHRVVCIAVTPEPVQEGA